MDIEVETVAGGSVEEGAESDQSRYTGVVPMFISMKMLEVLRDIGKRTGQDPQDVVANAIGEYARKVKREEDSRRGDGSGRD